MKKMSKIIILICYYINIVMVISMLIVILSIIFKLDTILEFSFSERIINIRMILTIPVFILWIKNIILWSKFDKNVKRFFLLFWVNRKTH